MSKSQLRPSALAKRHGLSAQAVRNYERDGMLPAADRTPSGYRVYRESHARALAAYLALIPAYGYGPAREIMRAVHRDDLGAALAVIDRGHAALLRDRETLDSVERAIGLLTGDEPPVEGRPHLVGELAHRLAVTPATLRKWERAGILRPARDRSGQRRYDTEDVRDADLTHLLRRGGYRLSHIAEVVTQIRTLGSPDALEESLAQWRQRLAARGRAMLTAAARLDDYLEG